jgi:uncharacterized protein YacL
MSLEFTLRLIGMTVFGGLGANIGSRVANDLNLPQEASSLLFLLAGALAGLIVTPWITTRPAKTARRLIIETSAEALVTSLVGLLFGIILAALLAWPLSMLPDPLGQYLPTITAIVAAYLGIILFALRAGDIFTLFRALVRGKEILGGLDSGEILLDTSVIIDGRILDISKTGFVRQKMLIPQFVIRELQTIADSSDTLLRQRGRHGLDILNKLRQESRSLVEVIDDMPMEGGETVDEMLVVLAQERGNVPIMTHDMPLHKIANLRGLEVLNINELALALRPVYLPGEVINLHIIQEGREADQGVGYLIDGTMVVVEGGRRYRDRTIPARITRYILGNAGKMYFAQPVQNK